MALELTPMTVADLTEKHIGWRIETGRSRHSMASRHQFRLVGLRTWTYSGLTTVGLVDGDEKPLLERAFDADTRVTLIRPETARAKRLAKVSDAA